MKHPLAKRLAARYGLGTRGDGSAAAAVEQRRETASAGTTVLVPFERASFNQTSAYYKLEGVSMRGIHADLKERYIVMAAAVRQYTPAGPTQTHCKLVSPMCVLAPQGAVLNYVEAVRGMSFAKHSMKLVWRGTCPPVRRCSSGRATDHVSLARSLSLYLRGHRQGFH